MKQLIKYNGFALVAGYTLLLLTITAHPLAAQPDGSKQIKKTKDSNAAPLAQVQLLPFHPYDHLPLLPTPAGFAGIQPNIPCPAIYYVAPKNTVSKTIVTILGMGGLSILGYKTNHAWQSYAPLR